MLSSKTKRKLRLINRKFNTIYPGISFASMLRVRIRFFSTYIYFFDDFRFPTLRRAIFDVIINETLLRHRSWPSTL